MRTIRRTIVLVVGFVSLSVACSTVNAQQVGTAISDAGALPNANAMLDVQSPATGDGKGMLAPRVTEAQRTTASVATAGGLLDDSGDLRGGAAQGLLVYQTDGTQGFYYNTSAGATPAWVYLGGGSGDFKADGSVPMTGDLNLGGQGVTNGAFVGDGSGLTGIPASAITEADPRWAAASNALTGDISSRLASNVWAAADSTTNYTLRTAYNAQMAAKLDSNTWTAADSTTNYASRLDWTATNAGLQAQINNKGTGDFKADGSVAMTGNLNMGGQVLTNVGLITFSGTNTAVGLRANGGRSGAALGYLANGEQEGAAVGYQANGSGYGVALGYQANAYALGVAVGRNVNGSDRGVALGWNATGSYYGVALGQFAKGDRDGVAVGSGANGSQTNIAIGVLANAQGGSERIAIGHSVVNEVDNSARIRGTLYLDGGTGLLYRSTFGAGAWTAKAFTIPHPLDPENKVLRHFCMEGPEVWNVYAGNAQLVNGKAVVKLPDYYAALNAVGSEVYSLTPVGGLFLVGIGEKVRDNRFVILGQQDGEVSWTIKVLRNDPGCLEDLKRRPVEQLKSELGSGQAEVENQVVNTYPVTP